MEERFHGRGSETLFTLSERSGTRNSIQSRLFLTESPRPWPPLAEAQAWQYPAERTAVIWELLIQPVYRSAVRDPREDHLLRQLWATYEAFLATRFPATDRLITTWEDDATYTRAQWAGFLTTLGYTNTQPATFVKVLRPV